MYFIDRLMLILKLTPFFIFVSSVFDKDAEIKGPESPYSYRGFTLENCWFQIRIFVRKANSFSGTNYSEAKSKCKSMFTFEMRLHWNSSSRDMYLSSNLSHTKLKYLTSSINRSVIHEIFSIAWSRHSITLFYHPLVSFSYREWRLKTL